MEWLDEAHPVPEGFFDTVDELVVDGELRLAPRKVISTKSRAELLAAIDGLTERLLDALVQIDHEFASPIAEAVDSSVREINAERSEYGLPPLEPPTW